ncbi:TadE family type IV pilus minor pilin [Planotetraspora kaengkrachanensis]|uniref:TadE-like protein n=1 Tax=Planotetraspora kaengkrachanensis TaxID=575193 RepID=A0A8J3LT36_9ACTN|nr:TadE family type IV pilus minor pilin [Planotetraspora kaengkrachanensis]GIG78252.1 hypothetical protein Pka01_13790 [Planotetraspora kaengkrachanensis]
MPNIVASRMVGVPGRGTFAEQVSAGSGSPASAFAYTGAAVTRAPGGVLAGTGARATGAPPGAQAATTVAGHGRTAGVGRSMRERGSVTAETAVALPALVVVLAAALWAIAVVGAQFQCVDAARAGARAAARGEPADAVREAVARSAPANARVDVSSDAEVARVQVTVRVEPGWGPVSPGVDVSASAVSALEPGVEP